MAPRGAVVFYSTSGILLCILAAAADVGFESLSVKMCATPWRNNVCNGKQARLKKNRKARGVEERKSELRRLSGEMNIDLHRLWSAEAEA